MAAVTYDVARAAAGKVRRQAARKPARAAAAARKPWYARFMDAVMEARMRQARREVARYRHLSGYTFDARSNRLVKTSAHDMPFGGW